MEFLQPGQCFKYGSQRNLCVETNCCGWCAHDVDLQNISLPAYENSQGFCLDMTATGFTKPSQCDALLNNVCFSRTEAITLATLNMAMIALCIGAIAFFYKLDLDRRRNGHQRTGNQTTQRFELNKVFFLILAGFFLVAFLGNKIFLLYFSFYVTLVVIVLAIIIDFYLSYTGADQSKQRTTWKEFLIMVFFGICFFISSFIAYATQRFAAVVVSYCILAFFIITFTGHLIWIVHTLYNLTTIGPKAKRENLKSFGLIVTMVVLVIPLFYCLAFYNFFGVLIIGIMLYGIGFILTGVKKDDQLAEPLLQSS